MDYNGRYAIKPNQTNKQTKHLTSCRFPKLKSLLRGHHFGNNDKVICAVEEN